MRARLFQLAGVVIDQVYRIEAVPAPGQEAVVNGFELHLGGGFNAMMAARKAGMDVVYAGPLGIGVFAEMVAKELDRQGFKIMSGKRVDLDQGCSTVLVDSTGERSFISHEGAEGVMYLDQLAALPITAADWILLSGYSLSYPVAATALKSWLAYGDIRGSLVFDSSPMVDRILPELISLALENALWVCANQDEARYLTNTDDPQQAAEQLAEGRPPNGGAIVRLGADGCHLVRHDGLHHCPGYPVEAVDTNGAGDTHTGYFIARVADYDDSARAARMANLAAALSTTQFGPATARHLAEIEDLFRDWDMA